MADMVISNAAMSASIAVIKAAQAMSANTVGLLSAATSTPDSRPALPYSRVLDKLA